MIINGGSRSNGAFFAKHLMKTEDNERVTIVEMKGLYGDTLAEGFREMRLLAAGGQVKNHFYHVNINPREDEHLTPEQWELSTDTLENKLGLTDHARMVIEHEKEGRVHRHVVWSRIDPDTMTAVSDSFNYPIHTQTARELEQTFNLSPVQLPDPPERDRFKNWENFRAAESGINPAEMKAEITQLWQQSDGGRAFQAAIESKGYLLAKGDRRDFVLIDPEGDIHSLARRIDGAKAADIRAKMTDLDRDSLMTAQEASAWMKGKDEAENSGSSDARILPEEQAEAVEPFHVLSDETRALLPPDHPLLAERVEYVPVRSVEEFSNASKAWLTSPDWQPRSDKSLRHAWEEEEARLAEIDRRQAEVSHDHDPPAGEPPVEPVSFERATRGIDPPQNFTEREPVKRDNETWAEFVTRQQQERDKADGKDKSDEKEPELER